MRYDSVQSLFGFRLDTWAALFFSTAACLFLALILIKKKKPIITQTTDSEAL